MIRRTFTPESPSDDGRIQQRQKNWLNILFLSLTPVIGVFGTLAYALAYGVAWWEPALFFTLFGLVTFSVTAGYHRRFVDKACVSHPAVRVLSFLRRDGFPELGS